MIMTGKALYEKVTSLAAQGKLKDAINTALNHVENKDIRTEITVIASKFSKLERDQRLGIAEANNIDIRRNQILTALLDSLNSQTQIEVSAKPIGLYKIALVSSISEDECDNMSNFFSDVNLEIKTNIDAQTKGFDFSKFDLVIYDNRFWSNSRYRSERRERENLMNKLVLEKINLYGSEMHLPFFLHFGPTWDKMSFYSEHFQGANSLFSLYHRILEVLEFIRLIGFENQNTRT